MKKIIINSALSLIILASATVTNAQDIAGGVFSSRKTVRVVDPATRESSSIIPLNEVNSLAARDFHKKYANAENVTWVQGKNGTSVYFTFEGIKMRSTYDKAGRREYTIKYFDETTMPAGLRHLVKSTYYDYSIDHVSEIERNQEISYLVKMQNAMEILTVKVVNGEIAVYEKLNKGN